MSDDFLSLFFLFFKLKIFFSYPHFLHNLGIHLFPYHVQPSVLFLIHLNTNKNNFLYVMV